jgi:hypothetical protein
MEGLLLKAKELACSRQMNNTTHIVPSCNLHISQSLQTLHKCYVSQAIQVHFQWLKYKETV